MRDWPKYVEQLEAHMDAGGTVGPNNVRDLIQAVREQTTEIESLQLTLIELNANKRLRLAD